MNEENSKYYLELKNLLDTVGGWWPESKLTFTRWQIINDQDLGLSMEESKDLIDRIDWILENKSSLKAH